MIHFSCDICGKEMSNAERDRYVVRVEIQRANDGWELVEEDIDEDHLQKVSEILENEEMAGDPEFGCDAPVHIRFDLCESCRERFLRNPFDCQSASKLNFSEN